ncbi:hypothetical protein ILYODFUR_037859 [Ilyodon furcidens]|uniref:Uncharacterized protein n=1 Tax=Ilyodon furcidens TaxID=33524 RepID=A0ABV0TEG4_9TELE
MLASLLLSQMEVQDSTDKKKRDAQPCQDDTIAKVSFVQLSGAFLENLLSVEGEDEASGKVCKTCKNHKKKSHIYPLVTKFITAPECSQIQLQHCISFVSLSSIIRLKKYLAPRKII